VQNTYSLLNIYAPNDQMSRNQCFSEISTLLKDSAMGEIIMGGDFNDVMLNQDRVSKITNSKPQRNVHVLMLEQLMVVTRCNRCLETEN